MSKKGISRPPLQAFDRTTGSGRTLLTAAGLALFAPLGLALVGALVGVGAAEAHDNYVSGVATCATDGTYDVTWTVANDYGQNDTITVLSSSGAKPVFTPTTIPASTDAKDKKYETATATQVLPGETTSASISISGAWADGVTRTDSQTIEMDGKCAAPVVVTGASTDPGTSTSTSTSTSPTASTAPSEPASASPAVCPASGPLTDVSYLVNGTTVLPSLIGVQMGDSVVARFTVAPGCAAQTLSLVTYHAKSSTYVPSEAGDQVYADSATGTFGPGAHTLAITAPSCNFQIDFVYGPPVKELTANQYHADGDFISGQNAGGTSCSDIPTTPVTTPVTTPPTTPVTTPVTTPPTTPVTTPVTTTTSAPVCATTTTKAGSTSSTASTGSTTTSTTAATTAATSTTATTSTSPTKAATSTASACTTTVPVTDVLGETFSKTAPTGTGSAVLPFTGNNTVLLIEIGGALLGIGLVLRALGGRRRVRG